MLWPPGTGEGREARVLREKARVWCQTHWYVGSGYRLHGQTGHKIQSSSVGCRQSGHVIQSSSVGCRQTGHVIQSSSVGCRQTGHDY